MADVHVSGGPAPHPGWCGAVQGYLLWGGHQAEVVAEAAQQICPYAALGTDVLTAERHLP